MKRTRAIYANHRLARSIVQCVGAAALFAAAVPAFQDVADGTRPFYPLWAALSRCCNCGAPKSRAVVHVRLSHTNLLRVAGVAVFGGTLAPVLMLLGLKIAPAASVSLWLNLEVLGTALFAISLFSDQLDGRGWVGVVLIALAGVLLASPGAFSGFPAAINWALTCYLPRPRSSELNATTR